MKTVFTRAMVAHVWAQRSQETGRTASKNFHFVNGSIYSYGTYMLATFTDWRHPNGVPVVLRDPGDYSVTTRRQAGDVREALRGLPVAVYTVPNAGGFREMSRRDDMPAFVVERCSAAIVQCLLSAAKRLSAERRAYDLQEAARYATLANLAADQFKTARERTRALKSIPAVPSTHSSRQELRAMTEVFARQEAASNIPATLREMRDAMRRVDYSRQSVANLTGALENAGVRAHKLATLCRKAGQRYPRDLPTVAQLEAEHAAAMPAYQAYRARQDDDDVTRYVRFARRPDDGTAWQWERAHHAALNADARETTPRRAVLAEWTRRQWERAKARDAIQEVRRAAADIDLTCEQWTARARAHMNDDTTHGARCARARLNELSGFAGVRYMAAKSIPRAAAYVARLLPESLEHHSAEVAAVAAQLREWLAGYDARAAERNAKAIADWRAGGPKVPWNCDLTLLRVHGGRVQTSRGAEVPVEHAKRIWPVIFRARTNGQGFTVQGNPAAAMRLGHFDLREVRADGSIVVGCHDIPWSEIVRTAETLGLYP